jgi:hypothetical protein
MITKEKQLIRGKSFMKGKSFAIMAPADAGAMPRIRIRAICARQLAVPPVLGERRVGSGSSRTLAAGSDPRRRADGNPA